MTFYKIDIFYLKDKTVYNISVSIDILYEIYERKVFIVVKEP